MENAVMNKAIDFENINLEDMKVGGSNDETFGEALTRYMDEAKISVEELSKLTGFTVRSIKRYRNGDALPDVKLVVAMCIAMNLHIKRSEHLLSTSGFSLISSDEHNLYLTFLSVCYFTHINIEDCNDFLIKNGFSPLVV